MKKMINLLIVVMFGCLVIWLPDTGAEGGEAIFTTKCAKCHGADKEAPSFSPVKFASSQWERFFNKKKHQRKKDISDEVSDSEMNAVKQYLVNHAADSDLPIAAGIK